MVKKPVSESPAPKTMRNVPAEERRKVQLAAKKRLDKARAELIDLGNQAAAIKDASKALQKQIQADEQLIIQAVNEPLQLDLFNS